MKIERISDEQVKFTLSKEDLHFYNIKYSDLTQGNANQGSAKLHEFFHQMMTQAMLEHNFSTEPDTQLIIETVPLQNESIMIIVTKTTVREYLENKFSAQPRAREERRYRRKPFIEPPVSQGFGREVPVYIYQFKSLNEVGAVAVRLKGSFRGHNSVYKKQNKYYLVLHNDNNQNNMEHFEAVLMEYGQKHSQSIVYKLHLDEYSEVIVQESAIEKLASVY